jgi:hypothetical protein
MSQYATITTQGGAGELPPELDPDGEGFIYGCNVSDYWDELDSLAWGLGIPSLRSFYFPDPELLAELGRQPPVQKEWHAPDDGLKTVAALLEFLRQPDQQRIREHFGSDFSEEDVKWVIWDLTAYERILKTALQQDDPFRIEIG